MSNPAAALVRRRPASSLFFCVFLIFNLNCRPIPAGDSIGTALVPLRLVFNGSVTLDPYVPALTAGYSDTSGILYHGSDGHYYSWYPIVQSVLISPFYLPLRLIPKLASLPPDLTFLLARLMEKIMASLIAAASVACLFLLVRRLAGARNGLLLALVYGFATNTWASSSQALWQHGGSQLAIVLSLLCLQVFLDGERRPWSGAGAAIFAALAPCLRPTDLLFWALSFTWLFLLPRVRRLAWGYLAAGAILMGAAAAYNLQVFHRPSGAYRSLFDGDFWDGLAGLTISPSHGLFVFSPVLLLSLAGVLSWLRLPRKTGAEVYTVSALFSIACLLVSAKWPLWWGGECYGPRLLADILPCMVLLMAPALDWMRARHSTRAAFAAALSFSVMTQVIGVFFFPMGFVRPEKLWDWSRCPIIVNASAGPALAHYRALAIWARQLAGGREPDTRAGGLHIR